MIETTLNPGDLIFWTGDPGAEYSAGAALLVADDGESLWFQFNPKPWHEQVLDGALGLTVHQAEEVLRGERKWTGSGRLFKCYDKATDRSLPDPQAALG